MTTMPDIEKQVDVTAPALLEVEIRSDGSVVWVHVNGVTMFRACRIENLIITDHRGEDLK